MILLRLIPLVLCISFLSAQAAEEAIKLTEDPAVKVPHGKVTGTIQPADRVKTIVAKSRATGEMFKPDEFDKKTGRFVFLLMPGNASYDVCIETTDGRIIEGVDLNRLDAGFKRLAEMRRKQLGVPQRKSGPFTSKDVALIQKFIAEWKDFHDIRRVLYIHGHRDRATVCVELMCTRPFYEGGGAKHDNSYIWRVDLWYLRRRTGGWERLPNVSRMLRRVRTSPEQWKKISAEYDPKLTALIDMKGKSKPVEYTIAPQVDPSRGRPAGSKVRLETKPHILGVDE